MNFLVCLIALATVDDAQLQQYADTSRVGRRVEMAAQQRVLGDRKTPPLERERAARRLAELESPTTPYYAPLELRDVDLEVSRRFIGAVDFSQAVALKVIDAQTMIVEFSWTFADVREETDGDERYSVPTTGRGSIKFWVEGVPTRGVLRGTLLRGRVDPQTVFAADGSLTQGGELVKLRRVDMAPYEELFTLAGDRRTWTDATGKHTFEAAYVTLDKGKVRLAGADGRTKDVPLAKLSSDDQKYVRQQIKAAKALNQGRSGR